MNDLKVFVLMTISGIIVFDETIDTISFDGHRDTKGTSERIFQFFHILSVFIAVIGLVGSIRIGFGIVSKRPVKPHPTPNEGNQISTNQDINKVSTKTFTDKIGDVDIDMIFVKGGTFKMGCTKEQGGYDDENPVRLVTVNDFYIGKYQVTQEQWVEVMGENPAISNRGDNLPVENVSWEDAWIFIRQLREMTGKLYRLLTEAEWEYAARGGLKNNGYRYSGSNGIEDFAWYAYNSNGKIQPVGTKQSNELGIHDMSGNVCEWVSDLYGNYDPNLSTNPKGPLSSSQLRQHVHRGGSWRDQNESCYVFRRNKYEPHIRHNYIGFRLAFFKSEVQDKDIVSDIEPQNGNLVNNSSYFIDTRDNQKYRTVKIGNLVWMCENLRYNIDDSCYYDDDSDFNGNKYGKLYTWDAAMNACPDGWRLPNLEEWNDLIKSAGGTVAGKKLKSKNGWYKDGNGTDDFGFSALPGGHRDYDHNEKIFHMMFNRGSWWSATECNKESAYFLDMKYNREDVSELNHFKTSSLSVRYVQDLRQ